MFNEVGERRILIGEKLIRGPFTGYKLKSVKNEVVHRHIVLFHLFSRIGM